MNFSVLDPWDEDSDNALQMEAKIVDDSATIETNHLTSISIQHAINKLSSLSSLDKAILWELVKRHLEDGNATTQSEIAKKFNVSLRSVIRREAKLRELFVNLKEMLSHFE